MNSQVSPPEVSTPPHTNSEKKIVTFIGLLLLAAIIALGFFYRVHSTSKPTSAVNAVSVSKLAPASVSITSSGFSPATITVKPNQGVIWINYDIHPHQVAADPYPLDNGIPGFNSAIVLLPKDTYSFIFNLPGIYHYHDQLNPAKFLGTVDVVK